MLQIGSYDYKGLIKSYLKQDRQSASTAGDRMSYFNHKLYSYNSVLAFMDKQFAQVLFIDKHISTYSNTSRKHTKVLFNTIPSYWKVFIIDLNLMAQENLLEYWESVDKLITDYIRSRKYKHIIKDVIHNTIRTAQLFAELHKLDQTIPEELMRKLFVNRLLN